MIIDSHTHISVTTKGGSFELSKKKLLSEMKKNKITKAIVIPDNISNPRCADMEAVAKLIKNEPKLSMVASLKIKNINHKNINIIKKLFNKKQALGFKIFPGHDPIYPTDKRWLPVIKLCMRYNLPLIIHTGVNSGNKATAKYNDPKYIIKLARNFKNLKIIIAHYFWPRLDYCFKITNGFGNIYFDTSALADEEIINESGGLKKIKEILIKTILRKSDSVLFGTDWPIGNIKKHIDLINSLPISQLAKESIFSKNAIKLFRIQKEPRIRLKMIPGLLEPAVHLKNYSCNKALILYHKFASGFVQQSH